ncbi:MAG TPA: hypothetical protein VKU94_00310 [Geobacterales bacterium]|nr:hypothetical protein [Geobacterales bacterium]
MAFVFEQAVALVLPFVIGLLVGYILKQSLKLLAAVVVLILILLLAGIIDVNVLKYGFEHVLAYGSAAFDAAKSVASILPYSSVLFIIGVAIGFLLSK